MTPTPQSLFEKFLADLEEAGSPLDPSLLAYLNHADNVGERDQFGLASNVVGEWIRLATGRLAHLHIVPKVGWTPEGPCMTVEVEVGHLLILGAEGRGLPMKFAEFPDGQSEEESFFTEDLDQKRGKGNKKKMIEERLFRDSEQALLFFIAECERIFGPPS